MECLSFALASTTRWFERSSINCHPIFMVPSASVSTHCPASFSARFRGTRAFRRVQPAAAAAVTDAATADPTLAISVPAKKVLVPVGFGTEEIEAVTLVHVLRQAGAHVTLASVEPQLEVETSNGLKLVADTLISSCADEIYDLIALPGGMPGSVRLRDSEVLRRITSKHAEEKRLYGAICAAPAVTLLPWGLLRRKQTTCHPAFMDKLSSFWAVKSSIQVSGELTTSRGPGTSFEFALSLVEQLCGDSVAEEVKKLLLLDAEDCLRIEEINEVEWAPDQPPQVLIPVADGCEEIEIVTIVDVLRRAKVNVVVASVEKTQKIVGSQGIRIMADKFINIAAETIYDLIVLPSGLKGTKQLSKSRILKKLLKEQAAAGRMYGSTCSSSALLEKQGLLKDKSIAACSSMFDKSTGKVVDGVKVVIDGQLITSKGLATTIDFSLAIVSKLFGHARARSVAEGLVFEFPRS